MKFHYLITAAALVATPLVSAEPASSPAEAPAKANIANDTHEKISNQMVDLFIGMTQKIDALKDEKTTQAAVDYIDALPKKLEALIIRAEKLDPISEEEALKLGNAADKRVSPAMEKCFTNMMQNADTVGEENLTKVMAALQNVGQEMEPLAARMDKLYPSSKDGQPEEGAVEE